MKRSFPPDVIESNLDQSLSGFARGRPEQLVPPKATIRT